MGEEMKTNINRFMKIFNEVNQIGYKENEGITRLAFCEEDFKARKLIKQKCLEAGFIVEEDGCANIWIVRKVAP